MIAYKKNQFESKLNDEKEEEGEIRMYYAVAWVVMLIAFGILEAMTAGLVSIWFCIGALIALIASVMGATLGMQIIIFSVVSLLSMALIRPFAKKFLHTKSEATNADRILGAEAVVTECINNLQAKGQIRVLGESWTARAQEDLEIPEGSLVRVLRIEGVKAIVTQKMREEG